MDGGAVNIADWSTLVALSGSPICMIVLTFFVWKMTGESKELKAAHKELDDTIRRNGFVKKDDLHELKHDMVEGLKRHDREIAAVRLRTHGLANDLTKLMLKDE